jgi:hypothetical protein
MIPGAGRLNKMINVFRAGRLRKEFAGKNELANFFTGTKQNAAVKLVSFSGKATNGDLLLCIRSFIKYVGVPISWHIFSDGTHTSKEIELLEQFPFVIFEKNETAKIDPAATWMEKKFYFFSSFHVESTTIFLDSDILFFEGFSNSILSALKTHNWYLSDLACHFDPDFLLNYPADFHRMNYVNSGFFVLNSNVDWTMGRDYLDSLKRENKMMGHFSEQTAMEIVFKHKSFRFLDPRLFCMSMEDHFTYGTHLPYSQLAIRHFVGPIRFRMWLVAKSLNFFE